MKIDEAFLKSKRLSVTTEPKETEEEAEQERDRLLKKLAKRSPKATSKDAKMTKGSGKFFFKIEYNEDTDADDPSVVGRLKRLGKDIKDDYTQAKQAKQEKEQGKKVSEGSLQASTSTELARKMAQFTAQNKGKEIEYTKQAKHPDGFWYVNFKVVGGVNKPAEEKTEKPEEKNTKVSNLQKQIAKLANNEDALNKLEKWLSQLQPK